MMEWQDCVSSLLSQKCCFDDVELSFGNSDAKICIPPIIKASILMLDKMQEHQGKLNIFVFPERIQSIFLFTLVKLIYNISEGRIEKSYSPDDFTVGENLRFGSAVCKFLGTEKDEDQEYLCLRFSNLLRYRAPLSILPLFQKTKAERLSKFEVFAKERRAAQQLLSEMSAINKYLKVLADYKTHMESAIVNMTSVINTKELIYSGKLCGQAIKDTVLIGQVDYTGAVRNIGAGQLGGTPAIVLSSDLYAIAEMHRNGHPIQSIIIDGSNANALLSQLPALDDLLRTGVPITCVTDIVNSFDLQPFLDRGFNLWRWDDKSITGELYNAVPIASDRKIKHCANKQVNYVTMDGNEISNAIRLLYSHRRETQDASAQMLKIFDQLFTLAFIALRETVPFEDGQLAQHNAILDECRILLEQEKNFISDDIYVDYCEIINNFKTVFSKRFILPKHEALADQLRALHTSRVALIVPERSDKNRIQNYWESWCVEQNCSATITVLYPAEYLSMSCFLFDATIVVGWLKRAIMRKTLFSFNTSLYSVLLYDYEKRWKNYDTAKWNNTLNHDENRKVIEKSLTTDKIKVSTTRFSVTPAISVEEITTDELEEIELILRENKYRQYVANGGNRAECDTTEAVPVNYVGGYLAFYRLGHKVISASDIIENDSDKIEMKLPTELRLGDFVVVRESDRDLIREMADLILEKSGMHMCREMASKWREALEIEALFSTPEEIHERLVAVGSTRGYQAVRGWISDPDKIAPQTKQDLEHIAQVTNNDVLKEKLDEIFDAAQTVKKAHIQAGRLLSQLLKRKIVEALKNREDIDPFNIWEPIEMQIDDIGLVRILKVIDIGSPIIVDINDTNRLIDEE